MISPPSTVAQGTVSEVIRGGINMPFKDYLVRWKDYLKIE